MLLNRGIDERPLVKHLGHHLQGCSSALISPHKLDLLQCLLACLFATLRCYGTPCVLLPRDVTMLDEPWIPLSSVSAGDCPQDFSVRAAYIRHRVIRHKTGLQLHSTCLLR